MGWSCERIHQIHQYVKGGMAVERVAEGLNLSPSSVKKACVLARREERNQKEKDKTKKFQEAENAKKALRKEALMREMEEALARNKKTSDPLSLKEDGSEGKGKG